MKIITTRSITPLLAIAALLCGPSPCAEAQTTPLLNTSPSHGAEERRAALERHKAKSPLTGVPRQEILAAVEKYFATPETLKAPEPKVEILQKADCGEYERWSLRYLVEEDESCFAYLLVPKPFPTKESPRAVVLCLHPTVDSGKDRVAGINPAPPTKTDDQARREARQYALDLVRRGFVTFAPDRAAYGERRLLKEGNYSAQMEAYRKYLAKRHPGWKLTSGKNVWDLQRGLDVLATFDFIDQTRIGVIGHSLGAWDSIMLMAMDERVKAAVVNSGGMLSFRPELWNDPAELRAYLGDPKRHGLTTHTNLFIMLAAPRPLLYLHSLQDAYERGLPNLVEAVRDITKYYKSAGPAHPGALKADFNLHLHGAGHAFPPEARELAYKFLETRLGLGGK